MSNITNSVCLEMQPYLPTVYWVKHKILNTFPLRLLKVVIKSEKASCYHELWEHLLMEQINYRRQEATFSGCEAAGSLTIFTAEN